MDKYGTFMKLKKLVSVLSFSLFLSINSFCPVKASTNEPVVAAKRENEKVYRQSTSAVERLSSLESLSKIGIIVKDEDILPVHIELNSYLYLDTQGKALVGDRISEYAIYCPMTDFDIQVLSVMIITKDDQFEHHKYELEPQLFEYFHSRMTLPNPEKTSEYCHNLNLQFYHMDRHPYQEANNGPLRSPTYDVDVYNEADLSKMTGLTDEFNNEVDFNDVSPIYVDDDYIKISFDDNPITQFIPKQYFRKPTTKTYLGQEYGFYINTVAVNANKNRSEYFLFKMQHKRGKRTLKYNDQTTLNNSIESGVFSFELRPLSQGRIFYFKQHDTVTGLVKTNEFCIENPTYTFSTNNANGTYNDLPDMLNMIEENKSCYIPDYITQMTGQTLSYKSYSPLLEYTKEFTSFMNSLPITDPLTKTIIEVTDEVIEKIKLCYDYWQDRIDSQYNEINFKRDKNTNKLTSLFGANYYTNENVVFNSTTNKADAMRGYAVSLIDGKENYNSNDYPILFKDIKDEVKIDFSVCPIQKNKYCFAQNVVTNLSFNLKKDETILLGKHTADLIQGNNSLKKCWLMSYDPYGELKSTRKINIGETYFTDVPRENGKKNFTFTPREAKTYRLSIIKGDKQPIYFSTTQNNNIVDSLHEMPHDDNYYFAYYHLEKDIEYTLSFFAKHTTDNSKLCHFRWDCDTPAISPLAKSNVSPVQFERDGPNSMLYSFKTPSEKSNALREPYLLQTLKNDPYEYPDTYIELLDSRFNPIMFSDKPMATQGGAGRIASIIMPLKPNRQYYVSVQVRTMLHAKEKVQFRIVKERELGVFDPDRPITYKFSLTRDNPVICYHLLSKTAGEYQFMIFGNNYDALEIDIQIPAGMNVKNQEKTNYSKGYSIMSCNLASPMTYFIFIYSKDPLNVPVNEFEFSYWRAS